MADVDLYTMNVPGTQDTLNLRDSRADHFVSAAVDIDDHALKIDGTDMAGLSGKVDKTSVGVANGVASLDQNGKVPASQLPKTNSVTYNSTDLVESGAVYTYVDKKFKATSRTIEDTVGFVGKNIVKIDFTGTQTFGSLSLTNNGDGTITVNGTNDSGQTTFPIFTPTEEYYNERMKYLPGRLTGCNGGSDNTYYLGACNGTKWIHESNGTATVDFPGTKPGNAMVYIEVKANQTLSNVVFRPMLVDNNYIDDGEFMPYHETVVDMVSKNSAGTSVDLSSYSSLSNKYTFASDGYISLSGDSNTSGYISVFVYGSDNNSIITHVMPITMANQSQSLYVKKGMKCYVTSSVSDTIVIFIPLV